MTRHPEKLYAVCAAISLGELELVVHAHMIRGYAPVGGVCVDRRSWMNERTGHEESEVFYLQALQARYGESLK